MTNTKMRAKVFQMGNKLSRDMPRREAFVEAWKIVKSDGLEVAVRGVSYGNRQLALKRLASYRPQDIRAFLVPENTNPIDPHAVKVMVGVMGGKGLYCLGYLPKDKTALAPLLRARGLRVIGDDLRGARLSLAL
jgi:hypothetical protein